MPEEQRFYSEEEAQQVLRLAARNSNSPRMSHDELVRAAAEMGISSEDIVRAENEFELTRQQRTREEEAMGQRREFAKVYRRRAFDQVWGFVSAAIFFVFLWYVTGAGYFWPMWVLGWWGVTMAGTLLNTLFNATHRERAFQKWLRKRERPEAITPGAVAADDDHEHRIGIIYNP